MASPCLQEQNIKEIQKDVQLSKERDILQTEQILNMNNKLDDLKKTMENFIKEIKDSYVTKHELSNVQEKVRNHESIINKITWTVITWVITVLGSLIILWIKFLF